jgi:hypothetical protein
MNNVTAVSAYVPLNVKHMSRDNYLDYADKMFKAVREAGGEYRLFTDYPLEKCWSYKMCTGLPPATETPRDRYHSPEEHVQSHIVQHTRTQWATEALNDHPKTDVVVWLDCGLLKQGVWNGNPISTDDVKWFIEAVQMYPFHDIPFPGIEEKKPVLPHGNNWRFCGSTHIWPVKHLPHIDLNYRRALRNFILTHDCVPLDLAIWPTVEERSRLPFKWYKAEYDNTQLRNFPCAL